MCQKFGSSLSGWWSCWYTYCRFEGCSHDGLHAWLLASTSPRVACPQGCWRVLVTGQLAASSACDPREQGGSHAASCVLTSDICVPISLSLLWHTIRNESVSPGTSLVQWLRLRAANIGAPGSIPGQGTRSHAQLSSHAAHNQRSRMLQQRLKDSGCCN